MLIAFEGMDGSGKSSISKAVSQRINIKQETQSITKQRARQVKLKARILTQSVQNDMCLLGGNL